MKSILVVGAGRFGMHLIKQLHAAGDEILVVDDSEERIEHALDYVTSSLIGDATDEDFIRSIGVSNFDVCIVAIGDNFQSSLEATSLLKESGAKFVVARASREVHEKFLLRNGADAVIFPEKQVAEWTAVRYSSSNILDYIDVPGEYSIFEVKVPDAWIGKNPIELKIRQNTHLNILGVRCKGGDLNLEVDPNTVFEEGSSVMVLGKDSDIKKHLHLNY
ncbi:MAG: TrkA family potassium uptake protein [Saccharofermentans sp.]|nr:TrkA family potassium uptake protein [Saccharofermentans sp.]